MTIISNQQCLCSCVTGAALSQWPLLSILDQFIDETLMNQPSARYWHLCLCLCFPWFWKAACDVTCLASGSPVSWDRAVSCNTLYCPMLQRMLGLKFQVSVRISLRCRNSWYYMATVRTILPLFKKKKNKHCIKYSLALSNCVWGRCFLRPELYCLARL